MNGCSIHVPVMLEEVMKALCPTAGDVIVDGTFGGGGHSVPLASRVGPNGIVIGLDRDDQAIEQSENVIGDLPIRTYCVSYHQMDRALDLEQRPKVDGFLLDLGLSSDQLADRSRGFSYDSDGPLDLRYDPSRGRSAATLLNRLSEKDLANIIFRYGEERYSRRVARQIVQHRQKGAAIRTSADLAKLVRRAVPRSKNHSIDPATRTFQALRIAVNDELGILQQALQTFPDFLSPRGRIAVISFHSLEDRIVKHAFRDDPRLQPLGSKPQLPSDTELARNPRSRSAKLRVAVRAEVQEFESVDIQNLNQ